MASLAGEGRAEGNSVSQGANPVPGQAAALQTLTNRMKRLESNYKLLKEVHQKLVKDLRDAEAYIIVLEQENQILQGEVHRLEAADE